jgi:hypothetical protein
MICLYRILSEDDENIIAAQQRERETSIQPLKKPMGGNTYSRAKTAEIVPNSRTAKKFSKKLE